MSGAKVIIVASATVKGLTVKPGNVMGFFQHAPSVFSVDNFDFIFA